MKNLNLHSKNVFDDSFKNFKTASESQKIIDFFQDKPYHERTAKLATFLAVLAVVCNILSGLTGSVFLHQKISLFVPFLTASIILVLGVVLIIEAVKRYTLPQLFRCYFQYKEIDFINLSIYFLAVICSVWLSFQGSKFLPSMVTEAEVVNIDSLAASYDAMIQKAEMEENTFKEANMVGTQIAYISKTTYNKLVENTTNLEAEKLREIKNAKRQNEAIVAAYNAKNAKDGLQLGYITLVCEIGLFLIIGFLIYRKWRHVAQFANIEAYQTVKTTAPGSSIMPSSFSVNLNNENRKQIVKTLKVDNNENRKEANLRRCKHCNNEYVYRHHKQKYCADACRVAAYNKRNGTNLKYK